MTVREFGAWTLGIPTEWGVRNPDGIYEGDERVAQVYGVPQNCFLHELDADKWAAGLATARLIALAPELLAALRGFADDAEANGYAAAEYPMVANARALIAKATGEQA